MNNNYNNGNRNRYGNTGRNGRGNYPPDRNNVRRRKAKFPTGKLIFTLVMITVIFVILWVALSGSFFRSNNDGNGTATKDTQQIVQTDPATSGAETEPDIVPSKSTVLFTGDVMYHSPQIEEALDYATGIYDFSPSYRFVKDIVSAADYAVVNFETTLAGDAYEYSGWPAFNSPDTGLSALTDAGFDMMLFANNHCYDTGSAGFHRTVEMFREYGVDYAGARASLTDDKYALVEVNGIKLGILNSTNDIAYGNVTPRTINGITITESDLPYMSVFNDSLMDQFYSEADESIKALESKGADVIIYCIHWGSEYYLEHGDDQDMIAQKLCDLGVDVIIGGHPHVVQDAEILTSSADPSHKTLCFYSLGNYISNQNRLTMGDTMNSIYTENGVMIELTFEKDSSGCRISDMEIIPTWVHRYTDPATNRMTHVVIPADKALASPEAYGLYDSSFGYEHCSAAAEMTRKALGNIKEEYLSAVKSLD